MRRVCNGRRSGDPPGRVVPSPVIWLAERKSSAVHPGNPLDFLQTNGTLRKSLRIERAPRRVIRRQRCIAFPEDKRGPRQHPQQHLQSRIVALLLFRRPREPRRLRGNYGHLSPVAVAVYVYIHLNGAIRTVAILRPPGCFCLIRARSECSKLRLHRAKSRPYVVVLSARVPPQLRVSHEPTSAHLRLDD